MTAFQFDNHLPADHFIHALRADVLDGLSRTPKVLPPKWFYDERGGQLFERITRLPEYYPTRAELEILAARAAEIAERTGAEGFVELGSGSPEKARLLLSALTAPGRLRTIVPVDVNTASVMETAEALRQEHPELSVHGVVADFEHQLDLLPGADRTTGTGPWLTALLGGTIGNLEPEPRADFLRSVRSGMAGGDWLLLGTDLVKSTDSLLPAYDDAAGVTAEFNRNVLHVINRELKADFDPTRFGHEAVWNAGEERVEMWLRSSHDQDVRVDGLDMTVHFDRGERMRTEVSSKFRKAGVAAELDAAGFGLDEWWTDEQGRFALSLARAVG